MTTPSERTLALRAHMDGAARHLRKEAKLYADNTPWSSPYLLNVTIREFDAAERAWQESWAADLLEVSQEGEPVDPDAVTKSGIPIQKP